MVDTPNPLQLDCCPLAADTPDVEHATVDLQPVDAIRGRLSGGFDAKAGPYRNIWPLVVQFRDQGYRAIALERFTPYHAPEVICGISFPLPLFHSCLYLGTSSAARGPRAD